MRDDDQLTRLVNQSGFPLQLAVEHLVTSRSADLGWEVQYREHGWRGEQGDSGFIDLVLLDQHGTSVLVVECKRVLEAAWLFLSTGAHPPSLTSRIRLWITNTPDNGREHFGYFDACCAPQSPESSFCVVAGQDATRRPMLERVASELVTATKALAREESPLLSRRGQSLRMYASVIVTTARLVLSRFDPSKVELAVGEASQVSHSELPWVRFRKQLSWDQAIEPRSLEHNFASVAAGKETVVFVVNVTHLTEFLERWGIENESIRVLAR